MSQAQIKEFKYRINSKNSCASANEEFKFEYRSRNSGAGTSSAIRILKLTAVHSLHMQHSSVPKAPTQTTPPKDKSHLRHPTIHASALQAFIHPTLPNNNIESSPAALNNVRVCSLSSHQHHVTQRQELTCRLQHCTFQFRKLSHRILCELYFPRIHPHN